MTITMTMMTMLLTSDQSQLNNMQDNRKDDNDDNEAHTAADIRLLQSVDSHQADKQKGAGSV